MPYIKITNKNIQTFLNPPEDSNVTPAIPTDFRKVPIITQAAAEAWDSTFMPLSDFISENSDEGIYFPLATERDFVVQIVGNSMSPWYPDGTYVLASDTMPITGDRVIVKMASGDIIFKVFIDDGEFVNLLSINRHNGRDLRLNKRSGKVSRIWPIKMSIRDERKMDMEMQQAGIKHFWERKATYNIKEAATPALYKVAEKEAEYKGDK